MLANPQAFDKNRCLRVQQVSGNYDFEGYMEFVYHHSDGAVERGGRAAEKLDAGAIQVRVLARVSCGAPALDSRRGSFRGPDARLAVGRRRYSAQAAGSTGVGEDRPIPRRSPRRPQPIPGQDPPCGRWTQGHLRGLLSRPRYRIPHSCTGERPGRQRPHPVGKRKASQAVLVQRGEYTPNPVCLPAAAEILRRRCAAAEEAGTDLVFEGWDPAAATALVRHTAEIRGWSDAVIWTGAHNARCGAAREVFDQALEKVMHAGMWDTMDSAELYGAPRGGEVDKGAGEQIRLESARAFQQQLAAENAELEKRTLPPAIAARPIAMEGSAGGAPDEPPRTRRGRKDEAAIAKRSATNAPATRKPARNRAQAKSSAAKKPARNRAQAKSPAPRKTARKRPEAKGTRRAANRSGASKDQAKGAGKKSTRTCK